MAIRKISKTKLLRSQSPAARISRRRFRKHSLCCRPAFRDICEGNACGSYGKCYMCPPDVGDIKTLMRRCASFPSVVMFQSVYQLKIRLIWMGCKPPLRRCRRYPSDPGQGGGALPGTLAACWEPADVIRAMSAPYAENLPCREPEKAVASLEAYGVDVYRTAQNAGLNYVNGPNTVTYFGMLLFGKAT